MLEDFERNCARLVLVNMHMLFYILPMEELE